MTEKREKPVSCIILAGGKGKRLGGQDKGLIEFDNRPLIQHIIQQISPQVDEIIISANRNLDIYSQYTDKVIPDKTEGFEGPLSGILSCVSECQHEWILVIPCDIPLLPDNLVSRLLPDTDANMCIVRAYDNRQLVFMMHASLINSLERYLADGHRKAMGWVELQNPRIIEFDVDTGVLVNINTEDDLQTISQQ